MSLSMATHACSTIAPPGALSYKQLSSRGFDLRRPVLRVNRAQKVLNRRRAGCVAANGKDDDVDWDSAWKTFDKQTKAKRKTGQAGPAPRFGRGIPKYGNEAYDQIRKDENFVLNAVTSGKFTTGALIGVGVLLFVFVVVVGPPPSDGRCTLPWC